MSAVKHQGCGFIIIPHDTNIFVFFFNKYFLKNVYRIFIHAYLFFYFFHPVHMKERNVHGKLIFSKEILSGFCTYVHDLRRTLGSYVKKAGRFFSYQLQQVQGEGHGIVRLCCLVHVLSSLFYYLHFDSSTGVTSQSFYVHVTTSL